MTCLLQLLPGRARKLYPRMQVRPLISGGGAVISRTGPLSTLDTTVSTALVAAWLLRGGELIVALQHTFCSVSGLPAHSIGCYLTQHFEA